MAARAWTTDDGPAGWTLLDELQARNQVAVPFSRVVAAILDEYDFEEVEEAVSAAWAVIDEHGYRIVVRRDVFWIEPRI